MEPATPHTKVSDDAVVEIRARYKGRGGPVSYAELAIEYGCSETTIGHICRGDRRAEVPIADDLPWPTTRRKLKTTPWAVLAACKGMDPDFFFPPRGASTAAQKAVCGRCPVRLECLGYAVDRGERQGVWGGAAEYDRRTMRRREAEAIG